MQTQSELVDEVFDYATLLGVILAGDADTVIDSMHRLALQIRLRALELREAMKCD